MLKAVADTHTVIWYVYGDTRLSERAKMLIQQSAAAGDQIAFSSITLAEVLYLVEKDRIKPEAFDRLMKAIDDEEAVLKEVPFDRHIAEALRSVARNQVPDLPDRIIAATAVHLQLPLLSRDHKIRLSSVDTIW